ncbi:MAG: two-component system, cell cycle sensor histidine kinase and response regulator CckA [Acidobacteriota bacterium]|nr:two-component system, cell cycle sensor histidine kinase and response regulator CckA [Acidobacteriota bacterium]
MQHAESPAPVPPRDPVDHDAADLLQLAIAFCDVRFGAIRLRAERISIVSDDAVPLNAAERFAMLAEQQTESFFVADERVLQAVAPAMRFAAAAKMLDSNGTLRGTLIVLDDRRRNMSASQQALLLRMAGHVARDIETADLLRSSIEEQGRLQSLVDEAPVAVFRYGLSSGRFSYVNAKFAETLGYSVSEILGLSSVTDIIAEDQRDTVREMIRHRQSDDDREIRYVTRVQCRDGRELDAEVHGSVADIEGARIVIGAAVDVTTHVALNRQLREREEYFRALTDHLSDIIAIVSREGVLTYVSPSIKRVLGHEPEELLGTVHWANIHPEDQKRLSDALANVVKGGALSPLELRIQHSNGKWRTLEVAGTNLLDHPQISGIVLNLHDITDRKRMEDELRQLDRLTSLGRLAMQVAHEFNNVLMGIQPIVEVVRRRATADATLLRLTDVINSSLKRGKRITTDILRFARPATLTVQAIDVRELVEHAADEIRPLLGERIQLRLALDSAPLHIEGDRAQLIQVLINLALNARDAMETDGGTLTLDARCGDEEEIPGSGECIHISIRDTGSGIDESDLPYIFEPLFTTKQHGTGLGLSIVLQMVAAHRGRITVDSEPEVGTTFHLLLPAVPPKEQGNEVALPAERTIPNRPLRVLIVDDEEAITEGLRWSLEASDIDVHVVARGAEVLPAIAAFQPDVALLDLTLPDEDGRSVYQRIATHAPIPVIFSSGYASEGDIAKLAEHSRTAFLMKPYSTEELLDAIHGLVGRGRTGVAD